MTRINQVKNKESFQQIYNNLLIRHEASGIVNASDQSFKDEVVITQIYPPDDLLSALQNQNLVFEDLDASDLAMESDQQFSAIPPMAINPDGTLLASIAPGNYALKLTSGALDVNNPATNTIGFDALRRFRDSAKVDYGAVASNLGNEGDLLTGDFNNSGQVEQNDLDLVLQNWGVDTNTSGIPAGWENADGLNGMIEQTELDLVLQNWGSSSSPPHPFDPPVAGPVFTDLDFLEGIEGMTFTAAAPGSPDFHANSPWFSGYFVYDAPSDTYTFHQASVATEAGNGNVYMQFAEGGDRTYMVIENPVGDVVWDISFDYSIPQSNESKFRIWGLGSNQTISFGMDPDSQWASLGDIPGTLLHETTLVDHNGWTNVPLGNIQVPTGYGAIVLEWYTDADALGGVLGIDNVSIVSELPPQ